MPYSYENEDIKLLRAEVGRWARTEIQPHAAEWEEAELFPRDLYRKAAGADLLGIGYPTEIGGSGGDIRHMMVANEEMILSGHSVGTCVGLGSHAIALPPVIRNNNPDHIDRFVRPTLRGDKIAALGITEPSAGSDVARITTRAQLDGEHYVVSGQKTFITSGCRADFVVAAVRTGAEGHEGVSLLIIESDSDGFSVSRKLKKTGWWASDTAELFFDQCRVPKANLIGAENGGFALIMGNFVQERLLLASQCVAIAQLALKEAIRYAKDRKAFGRPLSGFQVTRHKLADMTTALASATALTSEVTQAYVDGDANPARAAMAKNHASDVCSAIVDAAVQVHGGMGYMREALVERLYRDARLYPIGGGTREIMNELISKVEGY